MTGTRIGIIGLGDLGRQLVSLARRRPGMDVVAITDPGKPEILAHLLARTPGARDLRLEGRELVGGGTRARLLPTEHPTEIPWDAFGVDVVVDATGIAPARDALQAQLDNGAPRVLLSTLPADAVDRVVLHGIDDHAIRRTDRLVSAGSASTTAAALMLASILERWPVEHASMTSVHAYTSDQSLADRAGPDYRRSRSGAENIIPNETPAVRWLQRALPVLEGRMTGYALNVPVQVGSMLDLTVVLGEPVTDADAVRDQLRAASLHRPTVAVTDDPIVSSDVRGRECSVLLDLTATLVTGGRIAKIIGWHETVGHAARILDLVSAYAALDSVALRETA